MSKTDGAMALKVIQEVIDEMILELAKKQLAV